MTHTAAIKTAADIFIGTVEFLAEKHGVAVVDIVSAIADGNVVIVGQMKELLALAAQKIKAA